jgi:hypothetical protein
MSDVADKGGGKTNWEVHSLKYVVNAITSAQRRQHKLWNQIAARRKADGTIPVDWPAIEEYVEAVRRTHSLMIDLETVGREYEARFSSTRKPRAAAAKPKKARRKK